jgi:hypothetical protein
MARLSDLLSQPGSLVLESKIWTTCPSCRTTQWLHDVEVEESPVRVVYRCRHGCGPILTMTFGAEHGDGYWMRDWLVWNPGDLFLRPVTGDQESIKYGATAGPDPAV